MHRQLEGSSTGTGMTGFIMLDCGYLNIYTVVKKDDTCPIFLNNCNKYWSISRIFGMQNLQRVSSVHIWYDVMFIPCTHFLQCRASKNGSLHSTSIIYVVTMKCSATEHENVNRRHVASIITTDVQNTRTHKPRDIITFINLFISDYVVSCMQDQTTLCCCILFFRCFKDHSKWFSSICCCTFFYQSVSYHC